MICTLRFTRIQILEREVTLAKKKCLLFSRNEGEIPRERVSQIHSMRCSGYLIVLENRNGSHRLVQGDLVGISSVLRLPCTIFNPMKRVRPLSIFKVAEVT